MIHINFSRLAFKQPYLTGLHRLVFKFIRQTYLWKFCNLFFTFFFQKNFYKNFCIKKTEYFASFLKIKTQKSFFIFLNMMMLFIYSDLFAKQTTLEEYIHQVQGDNGEYIASTKRDEAYELIKQKAKLVTAPNFFANAETGYNEQITALPFFRYNKVATQNYSTGISQNFDFGMNAKFTYAFNKIAYSGLPTTNQLAARNYQTRPVIEATIPLLQNRFGSLTKATKESIEWQNEALKYNARNISINTIIIAEQNYWNLISSKKIVEIQKIALNQAEKILSYAVRKNAMNLGEESDILQAKALVATKKLELKQAQNDLKIAIRNFNKLRQIASDEITDDLENFDYEKIKSTILPKIKEGKRPDIKAAEANMKYAIALAKIEEENNKPSLNLYGAYAFKGVQANVSDALTSSLDARSKEGLIGLKFSVPFYLETISNIQKGSKMNAEAAKQEYRQKSFNEETDWENLLSNLNFYKERVSLAIEIENAQKKKLENERKMLQAGRTNTYQVLLFEQEYCQSQINLISSSNNFLVLMAQKKLYQQ